MSAELNEASNADEDAADAVTFDERPDSMEEMTRKGLTPEFFQELRSHAVEEPPEPAVVDAFKEYIARHLDLSKQGDYIVTKDEVEILDFEFYFKMIQIAVFWKDVRVDEVKGKLRAFRRKLLFG